MSASRNVRLDTTNWLDRAVNTLNTQMAFNCSVNAETNVSIRFRFNEKPRRIDRLVAVEPPSSASGQSKSSPCKSKPRTPSPDVVTFRGMAGNQNEPFDRVTLKGIVESDAIPAFQQSTSTNETSKKSNDYEPLSALSGDSLPSVESNDSRADFSNSLDYAIWKSVDSDNK
ncbi:hypothetical protein M3Y94_00082800 [Aphelenchoides besseyi]|nr:hypothetical protein M3Y94_00082800 [Aphelenchoides besseyi]KAI6237769.1 hypothetical protein M3Y95_00299800 [Aphelenchoides besseyi]